MPVQTVEEWKELVGDRPFVDYDLLEQATGLKRKTLRDYAAEGRMPKPDVPGAWLAAREDLARWVTGESRPGRGRRTDLEKKKD